ncbi:Receptor-type tyrosine-protein phosphatase F, partial [Geodia barretti]
VLQQLPWDVTVLALNSTAVFVQWGRIKICRTANGLIVKYRVQYRAGPNGTVQTVDKPGDRSSGGDISIAGLSPFTAYYVQVAAVNEKVPGPVASLTAIPSFFKICYTWREPQAPNGIITDYSIQYASSGSSSTSTILGSQNSFRTPDSYDMGSQVNLTVVAFTAAGPGAPTAITATTLTRPPSVEVRVAIALSDTSVSLYWNSLVIPDFDIANYTVVYTRIPTSSEATEVKVVFP